MKKSIISSIIYFKKINKEYNVIKNSFPPLSSATNIFLMKKYNKILNIEKSYLLTGIQINSYLKDYLKIYRLTKTSKYENEIFYYENNLNQILNSLDNSINTLEKKLNIFGSLNNLYIATKIIESYNPKDNKS